MAKKSAMSKGYRKTIKQKPFLTKNEIIALVVIVAAIIIGVIVFNAVTTAGWLNADEVQPGEVVSFVSTNNRDKFIKVADVGEVEGFSLEERAEDAGPSEPYYFIPDAETDHISSISLNASFVEASTLANSALDSMAYYFGTPSDPDSSLHTSACYEAEIQGKDAYVFCYTYSAYQAPAEEEAAEEVVEETEEAAVEAAEETAVEATEEVAEEPAPNVFSQSISAYVKVEDDRTLCMHIYREGEDDSFYLPDDQIVDYVMQYESAFKLS